MREYRALQIGIETASTQELEELMRLCIGRIFKMGSRPEQIADMQKYEECRWLTLTANEEIKRRKQHAI